VQIRQAADILSGLIKPGAYIARGEQEARRVQLQQAIEWLLEEAKRAVTSSATRFGRDESIANCGKPPWM